SSREPFDIWYGRHGRRVGRAARGSSMGKGKAVLALLAVIVVIAGTAHCLCVLIPPRVPTLHLIIRVVMAVTVGTPHHICALTTSCTNVPILASPSCSRVQMHLTDTRLSAPHARSPRLRISRAPILAASPLRASSQAADAASSKAASEDDQVIGTRMTINGSSLTFNALRCAAIPAGKTRRVQVSWQQEGEADCTAIQFFKSPKCTGKAMDTVAQGKQRSQPLHRAVTSARCIIGTTNTKALDGNTKAADGNTKAASEYPDAESSSKSMGVWWARASTVAPRTGPASVCPTTAPMATTVVSSHGRYCGKLSWPLLW
ncbi:unnamed protein product, partial [Closterium sp. NIES-53]